MSDEKRKLKLVQLVEDFELYPRKDVDSQHVQTLRWAIRAGLILPPIIVDAKTLRIIDGFHRGRAYAAEFGEERVIEVIARSYPSEREMFLDAMRLNASHGKGLTPFDRAHATIKAKAMRISMSKIAEALNTTSDSLQKMLDKKTSLVGTVEDKRHPGSSQLVPLKRTIQHFAGKSLTPAQVAVNQGLSGMHPLMHVNELVKLIANDMLDTSNARLLRGLVVLRDKLIGLNIEGLLKATITEHVPNTEEQLVSI